MAQSPPRLSAASPEILKNYSSQIKKQEKAVGKIKKADRDKL